MNISRSQFVIISACLVSALVLATASGAVNHPARDACCDLAGDTNNDGSINVSDITYFVAYLFNSGADMDCTEEADVNADDAVNISDLTYLVAYLFTDGAAPVPCPFSVRILDLQPGDDIVFGSVDVPDTAAYRIVLWAKTDRWYVQPSVAEPFTWVSSSGLWWNYTNPWDRIVALLVDTTYVPGATRQYHPSSDPGVVAWDEYPEKDPDRYLSWSGYRWRVKQVDLAGPGPNAFSDDTANVRVDQDDQLHLRIDYRDGTWYCSEIILDQCFGYGIYSFKLNSRVDNLDFNTIFAGFIFDTSAQEFDIEFSQRLATPFNAQFVVQPWYNPGNIEFFDMPAGSQTSHAFEWRADRIVFTSWYGHADTTTPATLVHTWTYTGSDIPVTTTEHMIFNLYLFGGEAPVGGTGDEVIVKSFNYSE